MLKPNIIKHIKNTKIIILTNIKIINETSLKIITLSQSIIKNNCFIRIIKAVEISSI